MNFSHLSEQRLATCHADLQRLFHAVILLHDCTVLCGHRTESEQTEAFRTGKSKVQYPHSRHNQMPSRAVDVVPYPVDWNDRLRFYHFAGLVRGVAAQMGIGLRWGGDWDGDFDLKDQNFFDLPHFELT